MKNDKYLDEMYELVSEALETLHEEEVKDMSFLDEIQSPEYDIYKHQPKNASWIHFFWGYAHIANEYVDSLIYANAEEFQEEIVKKIRAVFTPKTLEYIREAKVTEFGMHIGPYLPSGGSINDELGIEVIDEMKDREGIE